MHCKKTQKGCYFTDGLNKILRNIDVRDGYDLPIFGSAEVRNQETRCLLIKDGQAIKIHKSLFTNNKTRRYELVFTVKGA